MIEEKKGYSYNDLTIIPEVISNVSSRSECNCREDNGFLPIFTAPMASVVNEKNLDTFYKNGINAIIPRNIDLEIRKKYMNEEHWVALSLKEFEDLFINNYLDRVGTSSTSHYFICVDIANGHMKSLYDKCLEAKKKAIDAEYKLTIMTGNIANPETYEWIINFNINNDIKVVDYIRVGIGGGSGCFIDGTKIKTINGEKNIEDICKNDKVLTIDGTYQSVLSTTRFKTNQLIKINNEITSTINHKFFVINKNDKDKVNEQNLEKYGYWVEANKLDKNKHLLVKYKIKCIEIESIEYINNMQYVNDIEVENNHNYFANNYLVHNCITTSNVSIHYPQASLIGECRKIKRFWKNYTSKNVCPEIIADGGIRNYDHVIKALALGADYVMIGSLFAQCIESAGEKYACDSDNFYYDMWDSESLRINYKTGEWTGRLKALRKDDYIGTIDVKFFGMASADGQKSISGHKTKTAEGITKYLPVKYKLKGWVNNMESYLCSAMSYCDCKELNEFIGKPRLIPNSISEIQAVNK